MLVIILGILAALLSVGVIISVLRAIYYRDRHPALSTEARRSAITYCIVLVIVVGLFLFTRSQQEKEASIPTIEDVQEQTGDTD